MPLLFALWEHLWLIGCKNTIFFCKSVIMIQDKTLAGHFSGILMFGQRTDAGLVYGISICHVDWWRLTDIVVLCGYSFIRLF